MKILAYPISLIALIFFAGSMPARADDMKAAINAMEAYLEFVDGNWGQSKIIVMRKYSDSLRRI